MSNSLPVLLNQVEEFDAIVQNRADVPVLMDAGDLRVITKDQGTEAGRAIALITFTVEVDGKRMRAQTVTTVRLLKALARIVEGRYDEDGRFRL